MNNGPAGRESGAHPPVGLGPLPRQDVALMGMYAFLASLGMLFAASIVGYLVIRARNQPWPPPGFPKLPLSLWLSTLAILLSSATMQGALSWVQQGDLKRTRRYLLATLILGGVFLALQTFAWVLIVLQLQDLPGPNRNLYLNLFFVLSGLHAIHVLGGLGPLAVAYRRARAGAYSPKNYLGIRTVALYWHFLDVVWCVLFGVVFLL